MGAPAVAWAQGYAPEEAVRRMRVPAGLEVELVAAEPLVRQPVAIEFDDDGRLWVIQYLQYPNPAGLARAQVDRYSRTKYDKTPEPPPRGPRGADKITILEDVDGDGRAERGKDFVSGLNLASGLAFGHGGVFVLQVPYLLFYADRDRDDRPNGDPQVLLSGFGMEDAHSVANSLTWGPDGWLYGCQGSTVTSNIRGIEFQQGVWRYHPLTHRFELFCEGGGNSWGLDFDAHGNLFYSTNYGGYAMLHGVQGGYYWKQFGKHGALHNPHAYGYFDQVPHEGLRGGHVTVGGVVYQGDSLPQFRGKYIAADLLGHAAYWHTLAPRGSTFSARLDGDLLLANDAWFAPSDVTVGPDGSIYICDWHDPRTAHPDPDADWDRTNGRIYRIKAAGARREPPPKLVDLPTSKLLAMLGGSNEILVRKARRILADRRDPEAILPLRTTVIESKDDHLALEALWALYVSGGLSQAFAEKLLTHRHADVRWWTVRLLGDEERVTKGIASRLAVMAANDDSVQVRGQLASTAKRLPGEQALPIIEQLVARGDDRDDPFLPLLIWWAVERHAVNSRDGVLAMFTRPDVIKLPLVREHLLERLVRRYAAEGSAAGETACAELLGAAPVADRPKLLAALDRGFSDRGSVASGNAGELFSNLAASGNQEAGARARRLRLNNVAEPLVRQIDGAWRDDTTDMTVLRLAGRLDRPQAQQRAIAIVGDSSVPIESRVAAVQLLGEMGQDSTATFLLTLVASEQPAPLAAAALDALGVFDDASIADALLAKLPALPPTLKSKALDVLLGRRSWAERLLAAVDRGEIAPKEIAIEQLRVVALHGDRELDALVKRHWGSIQGGTPEERLAEMRRINNDLRAGTGQPAAGKLLFTKHCATCHQLFGEGTPIGPELTHANRKKTDELLATIVSPSAMIRKEYANFLVHASDGRILSGLLVEQSAGSITLLGAKNERTVIARDQVESLEESPTSLMPDNLLTPLRPQELRDLFSYLQSDPPQGATQTSSK
jgi:putative membrane-bound dehydrogenase-like protein